MRKHACVHWHNNTVAFHSVCGTFGKRIVSPWLSHYWNTESDRRGTLTGILVKGLIDTHIHKEEMAVVSQEGHSKQSKQSVVAPEVRDELFRGERHALDEGSVTRVLVLFYFLTRVLLKSQSLVENVEEKSFPYRSSLWLEEFGPTKSLMCLFWLTFTKKKKNYHADGGKLNRDFSSPTPKQNRKQCGVGGNYTQSSSHLTPGELNKLCWL